MVRSSLLALGVGAMALSLGCLDATQITVDLSTNVPCDELVGATVTVSDANPKTTPDTTSPDLNTSHSGKCKAATPNNEIGTIVLVPSGDNEAPFKLSAIAAFDGQDPTTCFTGSSMADHNCIIARRRLSFVPHTELLLPIVLWEACRGTFCDEEQTCVLDENGNPKCVGALISHPETCKTLDACGDPVLSGPDGGVGAGGAGGGGGAASSSGAGGADAGGPSVPCGQLALGGQHTCLLDDKAHTVSCWGANNLGQLGDPASPSPSPTPVLVTGLSNAESISSHRDHSCALVTGGQVYCWGSNAAGQLGIDPATTTSTAVPIANVTATKVAVGWEHSCAALATGVSCWGGNGNAELGQMTPMGFTPGVLVDGLPAGAYNIASSGLHTCAANGTSVHCWGHNVFFELGSMAPSPTSMPTTLDLGAGVTQLALNNDINATSAQSCALLDTGHVKCWGNDQSMQLGDGLMMNSATPVEVDPALLPASREIAVGAFHVCALDMSNGVWCWGGNGNGQVGVGTMDATIPKPSPVVLPDNEVAYTIAAGPLHTCVLAVSGKIYCWGVDDMNQLGDGMTGQQNRPVLASQVPVVQPCGP